MRSPKDITYFKQLVDIHLDGQWFGVCVEQSNNQHADDDAVGDAVAVSRPATRPVFFGFFDWLNRAKLTVGSTPPVDSSWGGCLSGLALFGSGSRLTNGLPQ